MDKSEKEIQKIILVMHPIAVWSFRICERWAMAVAMPDGEDSDGRAKLRLLTPQEVAERAVDIAERLNTLLLLKGYTEIGVNPDK